MKPVNVQVGAMRNTPLYKKLKALVLKQEAEQGTGCGLADALANLRHLADEMGQDFEEKIVSADGHYQAEVAGEEEL